MVLFDNTASRAQEEPLRLLDGYCGYMSTDNYAGYNAVVIQEASNTWSAGRMLDASLSTRRRYSPRA